MNDTQALELIVTATRTLAHALDDAREAQTSGDDGTARHHLSAALDARAALIEAGEPIPHVMTRELYELRREFAQTTGDESAC